MVLTRYIKLSPRPWPVFTLAMLALMLALKAFQLLKVIPEEHPSLEIYFLLPLHSWQDPVLLLLVWLAGDSGFFRGKVWQGLGWLVFAAGVVYSFLMLKFYALFHTFLTYDLLLQADHWESYQAAISQEVDGWVWFLLTSALIFLGLVFWFSRANHRPGLEMVRAKPKLLALPLGLCCWLVLGCLGFALKSHQAFYALNQNPMVELILSTVRSPALRHQNHPVGLPQPGRQSAGQVAGLPVHRLPLAARKKLNVVVMLLESMTPAYTGLVQPENIRLTPNLTALSQSSVVLMNHYCQEPASLKSLYSILTGKYSYTTRHWQEFIAKARPDMSLADILKAHGYATLFLTSADGRIYSQNDFLRGRFSEVLDMTDIQRRFPKTPDYSEAVDDRALIRCLADFLDSKPEKYFVMLYPYFPHHPYLVPGPEFEMVPMQSAFQRYQDSLFYLDQVVGEVQAVLQMHNQVGNTLLVLVSDHGEAFYQHPGNYLHSIYLYEENVHTVCMFSNPNLLPAGQYAPVTRHIDLAPTILDILGIPGPQMDGVSLLAPHPEISAKFYTSFAASRLGLRCGKFKYLLNCDDESEELYDLQADPGEKINLAKQAPGRCRELRQKLENQPEH